MIITNPFRSGPITRQQLEQVSRGWWALALSGLISIVAGGLILFTNWTVSGLVVFLGALFVVRGIFTSFTVPLDGAARRWSTTVGLLEVAVGVAVWVWPGPTLLVVAAFVGWWVLFGGVATLTGALNARHVLPYWGLVAGFGLVETLFAFWLLARPGLTLVAMVLAVGLWTALYGVVQVVLALEVKHLPERIDTVVRNVEALAA